MQVWLSDENSALFPFTFAIGDEVTSVSDPSFEGVIVDAFFEGEHPSGAYRIIYYVKAKHNNLTYDFGPLEIKRKKHASVAGEVTLGASFSETLRCRCRNVNHRNHKGTHCEEPAAESDGYCKECHAEAANEFFQTQPE